MIKKACFPIVALIFMLSSCNSSKDTIAIVSANSKLQKEDILFVLDKSSDSVGIVREGIVLGVEKIPDNRLTYRQVVFEMTNETKLNLGYTEYEEIVKSKQLLVRAKMKEVSWVAHPSHIIMSSVFEFEIPKRDTIYTIVGTHRSNLIGTESRALKSVMSDAMYRFLQKLGE